jgi:hypothetical protein
VMHLVREMGNHLGCAHAAPVPGRLRRQTP